jgi:glutathione S-transferase
MKLYGYRNGRTLRALWTLEEIGAQYEYQEIDVMRGHGQDQWFLELNPLGKVPVLIDDRQIITESAAICMHLAERRPANALLPEAKTRARTEIYKWVSFILTELDAPLWTMAKHRFGLPKDRRVPEVIETAKWEFERAAKVLEKGLTQQNYLVEDSFSVVDILAGHTMLWARSARIDLNTATIEEYLRVLTTRDAFTRAQDRAGLAKKAEDSSTDTNRP